MRKRQYFFSLIVLCIFSLSFLNFYENFSKEFFNLNNCPACYGSKCDLFLNGLLKLNFPWSFRLFNSLFNEKNVYFGTLAKQEVVLKKLAHNWELESFDAHLCLTISPTSNCDPSVALISLVEKYGGSLPNLVKGEVDLFKNDEAIKCQHPRIVEILFSKFQERWNHKHTLHHFLTLLAVNPEVLLIEAFSIQLSAPNHLGSCGRFSMEQFVGRRLALFHSEPWTTRANLSLQLLRLAHRMTQNPIRLYMTDPSADNFVVDSNNIVHLVDVENVVLVDSSVNFSNRSVVHSVDAADCSDCFSYAYQDLCDHFVSDHNYFAICKGFLSINSLSDAFPRGLLHSIPEDVLLREPRLSMLVEDCTNPKLHENRVLPAVLLSEALSNLLL